MRKQGHFLTDQMFYAGLGITLCGIFGYAIDVLLSYEPINVFLPQALAIALAVITTPAELEFFENLRRREEFRGKGYSTQWWISMAIGLFALIYDIYTNYVGLVMIFGYQHRGFAALFSLLLGLAEYAIILGLIMLCNTLVQHGMLEEQYRGAHMPKEWVNGLAVLMGVGSTAVMVYYDLMLSAWPVQGLWVLTQEAVLAMVLLARYGPYVVSALTTCLESALVFMSEDKDAFHGMSPGQLVVLIVVCIGAYIYDGVTNVMGVNAFVESAIAAGEYISPELHHTALLSSLLLMAAETYFFFWVLRLTGVLSLVGLVEVEYVGKQ